MPKSFKELTRKFVKILTPPPIGGLFISDLVIQYLELKEFPRGAQELGPSPGEAHHGLLRLPPGIVEGGGIKDRNNFVAAVRELHSQISPDPKKIVSVILSLPAGIVYVQTFNLPKLAEKGLSQAAELNAKMISPIAIENIYYGWQRIGESSSEGGQIELLGAFVSKQIVDEFTESLREAGFGVAAIEFSSLGLVRNLNVLGVLERNTPYLALELTPQGLDFMLIRNNNLYFDYSYFWRIIQGEGRTIPLTALEEVLVDEAQKSLTFYAGRWGGQIKNFILIAPALKNELLEIVKRRFPEISATTYTSELVNAVVGAALRGLTPRVRDNDITLTSIGAAQTFLQDQIINFSSIWRNMLIASAGFILLLFFTSDWFLIKSASDLSKLPVLTLRPTEITELSSLHGEVREFNKLIAYVRFAKENDGRLSPLLKILLDSAGTRIRLDRIALPAGSENGSLTGLTDSEEAAIDFKNKMTRLPQFSQVELPLTTIVTQADGRVAFTLVFKIKRTNF